MQIRRILSLTISLTLPMLLFSQNAAITLTRGTSYEVALRNNGELMKLPAVLRNDIKNDSLVLSLVSVKYDKQPDNTYIDAFNDISLVTETGFKNTYVKIVIDNTPVVGPGTYVLNLKLVRQSDPGTTIEPLQLNIMVKAASLRAPATVLFARSQPIPFLGFDTARSALLLSEQSGNAFLSDINIKQLSLLDAEGLPVTGSVVFEYPKKYLLAKKLW